MILTLSKDKINSLPLDHFKGDIQIISSTKQMKEAYEVLKKEEYLGFDSETKPTFIKGEVNPISLIQIATETKTYLFRILELENCDLLVDILNDEKIIKISQSADFELKKLKQEKSLDCQNFVDLSLIAQKINCTPKSLKALAAIFLGVRISKGAQKSNWERKVLTKKQIVYAATDAWICLCIFFKMKEKGFINNLKEFKIR